MKLRSTKIAGVYVAETDVMADQRGSFARAFCAEDLAPALGQRTIVQANLSRTAKAGTVRGMHFQRPPKAEMKFVRCLRGKIWDVALDLRAGSPTFLQWHAEELSGENALMMIIPEGCAHGFQALAPDCEMLYLHTEFYAPDAEGGVHHADPRSAIEWPLPVAGLSARDAAYPFLPAGFGGI